MFRATAITGELATGARFLRHRAAFIETKLLVFAVDRYLTQRRIVNIAELILRVSETRVLAHRHSFHCKALPQTGAKTQTRCIHTMPPAFVSKELNADITISSRDPDIKMAFVNFQTVIRPLTGVTAVCSSQDAPAFRLYLLLFSTSE